MATKKKAAKKKAARKVVKKLKTANRKPKTGNGQAWENGKGMKLAKDQSAVPKKLPWWQEMVLNMLIPTILVYGAEVVAGWLEKVWQENPQLIKTLLVSVYPFIDGYVENYAAMTKTKVDDNAVSSIKQLLEGFAAAHEIELPNVDTD